MRLIRVLAAISWVRVYKDTQILFMKNYLNSNENAPLIRASRGKYKSLPAAALCLLPSAVFGHQGASVPHLHPHGVEAGVTALGGVAALLVAGVVILIKSGNKSSGSDR
jgi:hypothetical protein